MLFTTDWISKVRLVHPNSTLLVNNSLIKVWEDFPSLALVYNVSEFIIAFIYIVICKAIPIYNIATRIFLAIVLSYQICHQFIIAFIYIVIYKAMIATRLFLAIALSYQIHHQFIIAFIHIVIYKAIPMYNIATRLFLAEIAFQCDVCRKWHIDW